MERARRARVMVLRARDMVQRGADQSEILQALDEAIQMLEKIERDVSRFRDILSRQYQAQEKQRL